MTSVKLGGQRHELDEFMVRSVDEFGEFWSVDRVRGGTCVGHVRYEDASRAPRWLRHNQASEREMSWK